MNRTNNEVNLDRRVCWRSAALAGKTLAISLNDIALIGKTLIARLPKLGAHHGQD